MSQNIQKAFLNTLAGMLLLIAACSNRQDLNISSPDGSLRVQLEPAEGQLHYHITRNGDTVLRDSRLGLAREDGDFSRGLRLVSVSEAEPVSDTYRLLSFKQKENTYKANRKTFLFENAGGEQMEVIFQVSDDGAAFRYHFPGSSPEIKRIRKELSSFRFPAGTKAWLQPMSEAKSGWSRTNPSYEEFYQKEIDAGTPAPGKAGWVFPALFRSGENWVLITETAPDHDYCAARLHPESPEREYFIGFPQEPEVFPGGALNPESGLPWYTPWRILAIGSLKTITESTLGTDLAAGSISLDTTFIRPGRASWSWALLKDESVNYRTQKQFIDYAADMGWEYCLVDVNWDEQIGYDRIRELADYAASRNVGLILWYNSSGEWNDTKYTPKSRLLSPEGRQKEFALLREIGIKGIKVDFFGGDGQSMIGYYQDILEDAAQYQLLVNFHGATLPRGWQRTYPHLMTVEAIRGFEFVTFEQENADEQPVHCTVIPFTRNVFDPMDFTPTALHKIPGIQRRTTGGFELALPVLFVSGIQHFAETPEGMSHMPDYVKAFLREVPAAWDETRFIDGYPGKLAVIARRSGTRWYVAGINGEDREKQLSLNLSFLEDRGQGTLISDGEEEDSFLQEKIASQKATPVTLKPHGGFVMVF